MHFWNNIPLFLLYAPSVYFSYRLIHCFIPIKDHLIWKIISLFVLSWIVGVIIFPEDMVNVLGFFIVFLLLLFFAYHGSLVQKLSVVLILYPIIISVNFLLEDIGIQIWRANGSGANPALDHILHAITNSLCSLLWWAVYRLFRQYINNCGTLLTSRMWAVIDIICLAPLSAAISLVLFTPENTPATYPAFVACIITSLGCIYLTGYIAITIKTNLENQNLKLQQTYYQELEKNQQETRKLRHDMNNHLSVIAALMKDEDSEKAATYFQELSGTLATGSRTFCDNSIVNAVINAKYNLIIENGIDCFFHIEIDRLLSIDDISLCSIFANTIDNALEASLQIVDIGKRSISVKARYTNGYFSYEIKNAKENKIRQEGNTFLTDKSNKKMHGFGLGNIQNIVAQYKGTLDITYDANHFSVVILIGNV